MLVKRGHLSQTSMLLLRCIQSNANKIYPFSNNTQVTTPWSEQNGGLLHNILNRILLTLFVLNEFSLAFVLMIRLGNE